MLSNILHLDKYLPQLIQHYGAWIYGILFLIVFCETGLVVLPFLPGDSLLFACGALSVTSSLNIFVVFLVFVAAAFIGDSVNYWIGREFGRKLFKNENSKIFSKSHLEKTEHFFDKYGSKAIILARFVPIVRTFAPFVAGMGQMHYPRFMTYNIVGALAWVLLFVGLGRGIGQVPFVKTHFIVVEIAIVVLSLIPAVIELVNHRKDDAGKPESSQKPDA